MDISELWQNIQGEFSKQNERLDGLETQVGTLTKEVGGLKTQVNTLNTEVGGLKTQVNTLNTEVSGLKKQFKNLNKKVNILTRDVKVLDTRVGNLEETTQRIDKRLDDTININIAKILNEQTMMRKEMNEKFDRVILQNNREHKELAYQIAKLQEEQGRMYG